MSAEKLVSVHSGMEKIEECNNANTLCGYFDDDR